MMDRKKVNDGFINRKKGRWMDLLIERREMDRR